METANLIFWAKHTFPKGTLFGDVARDLSSDLARKNSLDEDDLLLLKCAREGYLAAGGS